MKAYFCIIWCVFFSSVSFSQSIQNVRAEVSGNIIHIYYDLESPQEGQLYQVFLYSSHNDMARPLSYVNGDIGPQVKAGKEKKIEWQARKELSRFSGEIIFEISKDLM